MREAPGMFKLEVLFHSGEEDPPSLYFLEHTWELDGNGLSSHILPWTWSVGVCRWGRWAHGPLVNDAALCTVPERPDFCFIVARTGERCFVVHELADCTDGREVARQLPPDAAIQPHHCAV